MHPILDDDLSDLPRLLEDTREYAVKVLAGLDDGPAAAASPPPAYQPLHAKGRGARGALTWFAERWDAAFSGSAGPRYLGYVTGGTTPAAIAGDWLTGTFDQN